MDNWQDHVEAIHRSCRRRDCAEQALVLDALNVGWVIRKVGNEYLLFVRDTDADRARAELAAYALENQDGEPGLPESNGRTRGRLGVYGYVVIVIVADILKNESGLGLDWFGAGRTNAGLIRQGQWWRTVTALTLHVDTAHLVGNLIVGGLFGLFAGQLLGSGVAWVGILLAGAMGNGFNAMVRDAQHTSVGASTAVFGALGILAAHAWSKRRTMSLQSMNRWMPVITGIVLLGYLGTGGARTDVTAHVFGFCCGLMVGLACGVFGFNRVGGRAQSILAATAVGVLILAWGLAINHDMRWGLIDN